MPFDVADLRRQHTKLLTALGVAMDKSADRIGGHAVSLAQSTTTITNRTGAMRGGWKFRSRKTNNGARGELINTVRHALFQEDGTGVFGPSRSPYTIRPVKAKALRFVTGSGQLVFTRKVTHYGVHPRLIGKAAIFGRQAPFYGEDHTTNIATIEREVSRVTR